MPVILCQLFAYFELVSSPLVWFMWLCFILQCKVLISPEKSCDNFNGSTVL